MGNVHVIFRYFIDTQAGVVRVEHLLLHKGDIDRATLHKLNSPMSYYIEQDHYFMKVNTVALCHTT